MSSTTLPPCAFASRIALREAASSVAVLKWVPVTTTALAAAMRPWSMSASDRAASAQFSR